MASSLTGRVFDTLTHAQAELDAWVSGYNNDRPHQGIGMVTPAARFASSLAAEVPMTVDASALEQDRHGDDWITRTVNAVGVVSVAWQAVSVGKHRAGAHVDIHVTDELLQIWDGADLLKTAVRSDPGKEIRVKKAFTISPRGAQPVPQECQPSPDTPTSGITRRRTTTSSRSSPLSSPSPYRHWSSRIPEPRVGPPGGRFRRHPRP
ncbi:integrase core domain-containing protein [Agromyces sp. Soil535]|uniref:integrase core domain-containing protein n=1 Tax=Agromyces sp. Soil535 TaxID=1736390 RepID=UPI0009E87355|nr:integrase core domain-containing protein [Agromyces sp. Soil535]